MSENNQTPEHDNIEEILREYQKNRSERKKRHENAADDFLPPPVRRENIIDFSKNEEKKHEDAPDSDAPRTSKRKRKSETELAEKKEKRAKLLAQIRGKLTEKCRALAPKVKAVLLNKITLIVIIVAAVAVGGGFAGRAIVNASKTAYLKPYEQKYNVEFPVGILEKYCDYYGENQSTVAYLEIKETKIKTPVYEKSAKKYPAVENLAKNAEQGNFVVYMNDRSLEKLYSTADGYNKAAGEIFYSDLFSEYSFRAVGAFYTNTDPTDDNGYIFPYNTTEKMTAESADSLCDRVSTRLIYNVGITITRQDRLIFISCPSDYSDNFRFVLVGVQRDDLSAKPKATEKKQSDIRMPQVIYDEQELENPYRFADQWYPEYEITNPDTEKTTVVKTDKNDYLSRTPKFMLQNMRNKLK